MHADAHEACEAFTRLYPTQANSNSTNEEPGRRRATAATPSHWLLGQGSFDSAQAGQPPWQTRLGSGVRERAPSCPATAEGGDRTFTIARTAPYVSSPSFITDVDTQSTSGFPGRGICEQARRDTRPDDERVRTVQIPRGHNSDATRATLRL